jgi:hypothetical protein
MLSFATIISMCAYPVLLEKMSKREFHNLSSKSQTQLYDHEILRKMCRNYAMKYGMFLTSKQAM